jgi:hypothetical protein
MVAIVALVDNFNPWIVLSLNVVKGVTEVQLYNSIWKIFKLRLVNRYRIRCGVQCRCAFMIAANAEQLCCVCNNTQAPANAVCCQYLWRCFLVARHAPAACCALTSSTPPRAAFPALVVAMIFRLGLQRAQTLRSAAASAIAFLL